MAGAELLGLFDPTQIGLIGKRLAYPLPTVAVDDDDLGRRQRARAVDHVSQQGLAGKAVQHLGPIGFHARTLTGSEYHDTELH